MAQYPSSIIWGYMPRLPCRVNASGSSHQRPVVSDAFISLTVKLNVFKLMRSYVKTSVRGSTEALVNVRDVYRQSER